MKNIRTSIQHWEEQLERQWIVLPRHEQRKVVLYSFLGYILITIAVTAQICYEISKSEKQLQIEHIQNPIQPKKASQQ